MGPAFQKEFDQSKLVTVARARVVARDVVQAREEAVAAAQEAGKADTERGEDLVSRRGVIENAANTAARALKRAKRGEQEVLRLIEEARKFRVTRLSRVAEKFLKSVVAGDEEDELGLSKYQSMDDDQKTEFVAVFATRHDEKIVTALKEAAQIDVGQMQWDGLDQPGRKNACIRVIESFVQAVAGADTSPLADLVKCSMPAIKGILERSQQIERSDEKHAEALRHFSFGPTSSVPGGKGLPPSLPRVQSDPTTGSRIRPEEECSDDVPRLMGPDENPNVYLSDVD
jgi:hypothetical protein